MPQSEVMQQTQQVKRSARPVGPNYKWIALSNSPLYCASSELWLRCYAANVTSATTPRREPLELNHRGKRAAES